MGHLGDCVDYEGLVQCPMGEGGGDRQEFGTLWRQTMGNTPNLSSGEGANKEVMDLEIGAWAHQRVREQLVEKVWWNRPRQ